jgi:hypothetical protein
MSGAGHGAILNACLNKSQSGGGRLQKIPTLAELLRESQQRMRRFLVGRGSL